MTFSMFVGVVGGGVGVNCNIFALIVYCTHIDRPSPGLSGPNPTWCHVLGLLGQ